MKPTSPWLIPFFALALLPVAGCGTDDADSSPAGVCTIVDLGDGTSAIRCPDGSEVVVRNGADGEKGDKGEKGDDRACTLGESDGKYTLTCGDHSVVIGDSCADGFPLDVVVRDDTDEYATLLTLFEVSNCTWIRGDVSIRNTGEIPPALLRVERIDGDLEIVHIDLEELILPNLTELATGVKIAANASLAKVELPSLTTAGIVLIAENDALTSVSMPVLGTVGEGLAIYNNPSLPAIDGFSAVESMGTLYVAQNASLETIGNFASLVSVGSIELWDNDALESVAEFPALEELKGFGDGASAEYSILWASDNAVLSSFGKLGSVSTIDGHVSFMNNPELLESAIDDLLDGIDVTGTVVTCGNKGGSGCL